MKKSLLHITVLLTVGLVGLQSVSAQYGYGNRYGRQRSTVPQAQEAPREPEKLTAAELVDERMPSITEALELNPFEEAVVRTTLTKYVQKKLELQILELEPQKMREEYVKLGKLQNEELKAGLPEDKIRSISRTRKKPVQSQKEEEKEEEKQRVIYAKTVLGA